jgi:hypothetical protein
VPRLFSRLLATWTPWIARPWLAVIVAGFAAAATLVPNLSGPGLWEPQELAIADVALARADAALAKEAADKAARDAAAGKPAQPPQPPLDVGACTQQPSPDAIARTFNDRALQWTLRDGQASERALRLPFAVLGVLTVLATAGLAARLAGARAALLAALILLSFPLLVMQARQLTTELATTAGATLLLYGLVSLRPFGRTLWRAVSSSRDARRPGSSLGRGVLHLLDDLLSLAAIAAGAALGFLGGGALLGVLVPVLAFACATGLGSRGGKALGRLCRGTGTRCLDVLWPRRRRGRALAARQPLPGWIGDPSVTWLGLKGLVAAVASLALFYVLLSHAYKLGPLTPGTRQIFGHSILPTFCYSWALGGVWQASDDLRILYDSSVEQIAFGTFPWGLIAPLAMGILLASERRPYRLGGALCLAWAAVAWVATEAFQRKVGHTVYPGFPALALAVALWLDSALTWARDAATRAADGDDDESPRLWRARIAAPLTGRLLLGLFFLLGAFTVGKDILAFPDRLASLVVGDDAVKYPELARWLFVPTRAWILALGTAIALFGALWMWDSTDHGVERQPGHREGGAREAPPRRSPRFLSVALGLTAALAAFWAHAWHPSLSALLSSKGVFASYHSLRKPGDQLVLFGDLGNAPKYYAGGPYQTVHSRDEILTALAGKPRVFALVPASELCSLHRQAAGSPYFVLDNDNARTLLVSNRVTGTSDRNPLLTSLYRSEPAGITSRPPSRIVFDDRIELIGWTLPAQVRRGERFTATLYYKILAPVGGAWRVFQHYDRSGGRFIGDHVPLEGRCPTTEWTTGDYIVDRHTLVAGAGGMGPGSFDLWTGFFNGVAPSWRNMKVTQAPDNAKDADDRVKITSVTLR